MKTISCKEAVDFMLKKEERKLSFRDQLKLWRHLLICNLCAIFLKQNNLINSAAKRRQQNQYQLTEDDKEKIIRNVLDDINP
jgi:hypothetical protein